MLEGFNSEKFEYKRLTEAEQKARGILGRLKGVIADTKNSTRNGRKYSSKLWENVFNNDVMKEKIANRCVFGELGHPADREETDMEKIAICLAEQPKLGDDGKIYGVFDILSTPNGRILKSLCDYGCTVGVSSRGSGDLYTDDEGNEAVDPDTYNCECWDVVLVPAVKEARMQYVTESLEKKKRNKTLRQALQESLDKANEDDKLIMNEALGNLGIILDEEVEYDDEVANQFKDEFDIASKEECEKTFNEADDRYAEFNPEDAELHKNTDWKARNYEDLPVPEDSFESDVVYYKHGEKPEQKTTKFIKYLRANPIYPPYYAPEEKPFDDAALGPMYNGNFYNMYDLHDRYEDQATYDRMSEAYMNERLISTLRDSQGVNEECNNESCSDKDAEEVVNDKSGELVAEFQEALLKIKMLEDDNLSLQEKLSVCNAKESELTEQLGKYKAATVSLSDTAKKAKSLNEDKAKLEESLNKQEAITSRNKARIDSLIDTKKDLTAQLTEAKAQVEELNGKLSSLNESLDTQSKQLDSTKETLNKYKKNYAALKESFLEAKAVSYGLEKDNVKANLKESYSLKDVDTVCEQLYSEKSRLSKLPFVVDKNTNISFKKSKNEYIMNESLANNSDDYISDSLLHLANLR